MFQIFNENYYLDLDELESYTQFTGSSGETNIHLVKYETVKTMIDVVLSEENEVDENLGLKTNEVSIPFKIAFNTLLMKKIINKI
jgi:hypothetical protein